MVVNKIRAASMDDRWFGRIIEPLLRFGQNNIASRSLRRSKVRATTRFRFHQ
jgi:hypothetical protein